MSVAVVTGAARGFGLEIARRLVDRGHDVVVSDIDEGTLAAAAAELGPRARAVPADVRDPGSLEQLGATASEIGELAVWVNNAGVARAGKAWEQSEQELRLMVEANLLGVMHGSATAVRLMADGGGHILNVGSMSSFGPVPGIAVYAATKAAVLNFGASLQGDIDHAGLDIRVHTICPDAADTKLVRDEAGSEDAAILFSNSRLLDAGEVADAAVAMLDGRRIHRAFPRHRAALVRFAARHPALGLRLFGALRSAGDKRRRRAIAD